MFSKGTLPPPLMHEAAMFTAFPLARLEDRFSPGTRRPCGPGVDFAGRRPSATASSKTASFIDMSCMPSSVSSNPSIMMFCAAATPATSRETGDARMKQIGIAACAIVLIGACNGSNDPCPRPSPRRPRVHQLENGPRARRCPRRARKCLPPLWPTGSTQRLQFRRSGIHSSGDLRCRDRPLVHGSRTDRSAPSSGCDRRSRHWCT